MTDWAERWRDNRIGFHEGQPNAFLVTHANRLASRRRVLVPLCGKAEDLAFLAARGHQVVGVELVEDAVRAFFTEHALTPVVTPRGALIEYAADGLTLYAGDIFAATRALIGEVDAVYDRAALVALDADVRSRYAEHLRRSGASAILQVTTEYEQTQYQGPPWSVTEAELRTLYVGAAFELLEEKPDVRIRADGPPMLDRCFWIAL